MPASIAAVPRQRPAVGVIRVLDAEREDGVAADRCEVEKPGRFGFDRTAQVLPPFAQLVRPFVPFA